MKRSQFPHAGLAPTLAATLLFAVTAPSLGDSGFDLRDGLVPADQIHAGGPPRDGIPAIDHPLFVPAADAHFLDAADGVLGLAHGGRAKAYPVSIMNWHEIVNDRIGADRIAVTYCPLCGTGVAFRSRAGGRELSLGVSGLLYNSDLLLYDRETESLWSQLLKQAVTGPLKGKVLDTLPLTHTTWGAWRREHPDTLVLSIDTGFRRDYGRDPYQGYGSERRLYFPVGAESARYHPKERVLGLEIDEQFKAYPFSELARTGREEIADRLAGREIRIRFDGETETARAFDAQGNRLPGITGFWFAWYAFHPGTEVFTAEP